MFVQLSVVELDAEEVNGNLASWGNICGVPGVKFEGHERYTRNCQEPVIIIINDLVSFPAYLGLTYRHQV